MTVERDWFWFWFWFYYALWLASVFTLVLVLRQSSENRSILVGFSCLKITLPAVALSIRELMHDDGDGNGNGKKATALDKENNNFARASHFFAHFFAVVSRLRRETA